MRIGNKKYSDGVFDINGANGFNPAIVLSKTLPPELYDLENLVDNMPVFTDFENNVHGYLNEPGRLLKEVDKLPNYYHTISKYTNDPELFQKLYRAYTFLASAYLLEPSYQEFVKTGRYGKGLNVLPENIAQPLCYVAEKLNVYPWLDYHYSYCLGNCVKIDQDKPGTQDNLKMLVSFAGTEDERGFVCVHVDINSYSANLIKSIENVLGSLGNSYDNLVDGLRLNYETMKNMNERRMGMWKASNYKKYNDFRVFIMGITGNDEIFGDGVVYEGVEKFKGPQQFRGQSGSQDDIIPVEDIFTGVYKYYPDNLLTQYLYDMRSYRPQVVQEFMRDLSEDSKDLFDQITEMCTQSKNANALFYLLLTLEQVYKFRNGHWMFVQKYIMSNTTYAKATGGTPITTWLPNQIQACLQYMNVVSDTIKYMNLSENLISEYNRLVKDLTNYKKILSDQLKELGKEHFDPAVVFELNSEYRED